MAAAEHNGIDQPLIDRLLLNDKGIDQMIEGILQVDALKDPVGEMSDFSYRPTGIQIGKMRVPLGVIAMIYESRPNVTVDAASLSVKSYLASARWSGSVPLNKPLRPATQGLTRQICQRPRCSCSTPRIGRRG